MCNHSQLVKISQSHKKGAWNAKVNILPGRHHPTLGCRDPSLLTLGLEVLDVMVSGNLVRLPICMSSVTDRYTQ